MALIGDVAGKRALIVDDEIASGGTLIEALAFLQKQGATAVEAAAVHPVLSGQAVPRIADSALEAVARTGTLLLNQSVLLKGINDNADRLESLSRALFNCRVLPYYLHLLDPVSGAAHFDVPASRGTQLIERLRRRLPGYLVPRLVRETPGETSKTTIA